MIEVRYLIYYKFKTTVMKKLKYILFTALAGLLACDSFTELDAPPTQIASSEVFIDKSGAEAALADIYARIREEGAVSGNASAGTVLLANYADDLAFYGANANLEQFSRHTLVDSNTYLNTLWRAAYSQIYAVNSFREGVLGAQHIGEEDRDRFLGEALFLRGFLHFYLVNIFGSIPYVTSTDYEVNRSVGKISEQQAYGLIVQDLLLAAELIPETYPSAEPVRPNKSAVHALLSRVSLYTGDWQEAAACATLVIESPMYSWQLDLDQEFLRTSPATIWSLHPGLAGVNTRDARSFVFLSGPPSIPTLSPELYASFEDGDLRRTAWVSEIQGTGGPWYHASKYKKITNTGSSEEYTVLFRLAEMHLIRAECRTMLHDLEGARSDIDKIRSRAGLGGTTASTEQALLAAVLQERRLELFTEQGHRFFDLKRTGNADQVLSIAKPNWRPTDVLFPLPLNELLLNGNLLPQNTGY